MKVLVIDAQGGGIGKQVVAAIKHKQYGHNGDAESRRQSCGDRRKCSCCWMPDRRRNYWTDWYCYCRCNVWRSDSNDGSSCWAKQSKTAADSCESLR